MTGRIASHAYLYNSAAWRGPHGLRKQALRRDKFTCQRCGCMLVAGSPNHPRAATVNHRIAHRGDAELFFDLENVESVCKTCHDGLIQREEERGYKVGCDGEGRPVDPAHPWNLE
ncbi:HNH endonuclease [Chelativorans sp. ZYF759]|uniref:HNH endonuclease n=1 Tax=Chelativorans sp. ZYF759 TaxID=2692213 RepID=UPI00145E83A6|nr:HNH endonuclease [Chelativorans sp. ZYF759]NMG39900.1 HNH endonuclease [Chelativorans sp. ZYF759]